MGRGRAKAKQTKVARQLKYNSGGGTDLSRLAEELGASPAQQPPNGEPFEDDEDDDPYARYAELYNADDVDEDSEEPSRQRRA
ncbi:DUF3073 domain-containing protein [Streptomyces sp. TRM 70351]|uniref:DUF3073 domain-containing protein n=1 Tax=Streptomyces sp. TRM 70351 TaxID=3116552 RepID=UPI002E7AD0FD|nr:DUF3073 domain-containing protein [Streptomyces sp. TRM 70351]MEE1929851.1 DUF3073 domain-containing protein [Streptomyces sp. TRM 70351]